MTTLAELDASHRQVIDAATEIASARSRALDVLAEAGVEDAAEILDAALELEDLPCWPAGQERLEHAQAVIATIAALYTTDHSRVGQRRPEPISLSLRQIDRDDRIQVRVLGTDPDLVRQYADAMLAGDEFPPLVCFVDRDERALWLADGFHRYDAAAGLGRVTVSCAVYAGTRLDAAEYAATCNTRHGLPMTASDKREAIKRLLRLHPDWSSRQISRLVGSSPTTVETIRQAQAALEDAASVQIGQIEPTPRTVERGDQTYTYTPPAPPEPRPAPKPAPPRATPGGAEAAQRMKEFFRGHHELSELSGQRGWAAMKANYEVPGERCIGCNHEVAGQFSTEGPWMVYRYEDHVPGQIQRSRLTYACPVCWQAAGLPDLAHERAPTVPGPPAGRGVTWSPGSSAHSASPGQAWEKLRGLLITGSWVGIRDALVDADVEDWRQALCAVFGSIGRPTQQQIAAGCLKLAVLDGHEGTAVPVDPAPIEDRACPHCGGTLVDRTNGTAVARTICQDCGAFIEEAE